MKLAFFEDLSKYEYSENNKDESKNIGWLDGNCNFSKGVLSDDFVSKLWEYVKYPINRTRGVHQNEFLDGVDALFVADFNGYEIHLGAAEIRVVDEINKCIYAAPDLIIHYILNHKYLPPVEFVQAVITGPKPCSEEYFSYIKPIITFRQVLSGSARVCSHCYSKNLVSAYGHSTTNEEKKHIIKKYSYGEFHQNKMDRLDMICLDCGRVTEVEL